MATKEIAFVNTKSGNTEVAAQLLAFLREVLSPSHVFDLAHHNPQDVLTRKRERKDIPVYILVAGGDGTVAWVLSALELTFVRDPPAVALLPLGTGNDLSRHLGWGPGIESMTLAQLKQHVERCRGAKVQLLDRWNVHLTPLDAAERPTGVSSTFVMNNYMSIGCDAAVAHEFHELREGVPLLTSTRTFNKAYYIFRGGVNFFVDHPILRDIIELRVDGKRVDIPPDIAGLIIMNISSYAAGSRLWPEDGGDSSSNDGVLEVLGVTGTFQMAAGAIGIPGVPIAQGSGIEVTAHVCELDDEVALPMQIDGEPWKQTLPAFYSISPAKALPVLTPKQSESSRGILEVVGDIITKMIE